VPVQEYVIVSNTPSGEGYMPVGNVRDFFAYRGSEAILSGPYETGKTIGALYKLHLQLSKYPNARALVVRKQYSDLKSSAWMTYIDKVLPFPPDDERCPVEVIGGNNPFLVRYPNGSLMRLGGLDINPNKVLSAEYDFIFVPQAEELDQDDWQMCLGRTTGRSGNTPYTQITGDCNPDVPTHWILNRPTLRVFHTLHTDNPTLFRWDSTNVDGKNVLRLRKDDNGDPVPTPQGEKTMSILSSLTGVLRERGFLGHWVGAEGQVYPEFRKEVHVIKPFNIPPDWPRFRVFDFGYRHPFVCQWWAEDGDGRLYLYREVFHTERTVQQHVSGEMTVFPGIRELSGQEVYEANICDWNAEDRATLEAELGIRTLSADKAISSGIQLVQERLTVQGDGKPRIMFFQDARVEVDDELRKNYRPTSTIEEFPGYVWPGLKESVARASDERPIKLGDDGMDAMRYMVAYRDMHIKGKPGSRQYV
jgi:phage terminase large subunit